MFRVDSFDVIDATECGDAARFINHSCEVSHQRQSFYYVFLCLNEYWKSWITISHHSFQIQAMRFSLYFT